VAHHRGYTDGLSNWPGNLWTFLEQQRALSGAHGWVGPLLGGMGALAISGLSVRLILLAFVGLSAIAGFFAGDAAFWLVGPILALLSTWRSRPHMACHSLWLVSLFALTPIYHPYVRLLLPLTIAGWLAFGWFVGNVFERTNATAALPTNLRRWPVWPAFTAATAVILLAIPVVRSLRDESGADGEPTTLQLACKEALSRVPTDEPVHCFVRPPVLVYAAHRQIRLMDPDTGIASLCTSPARNGSIVLVDRALVRDNRRLQEHLLAASGVLRERARVGYRPGQRVTLDDFGRDATRPEFDELERQTYELVVYAIESGD
jgi:hypothetical protein